MTTSIEFVRDQTSAVRYGHQDLVVIYLDTPSGHESEYDADGVEHHDGMETVETDMEDGESAMDPRRDHPYHLLAVVESVTWQTLTLQVVVYNALPDFPGHERDFNRMVKWVFCFLLCLIFSQCCQRYRRDDDMEHRSDCWNEHYPQRVRGTHEHPEDSACVAHYPGLRS